MRKAPRPAAQTNTTPDNVCPVCGDGQAALLCKVETFDIYKCAHCGGEFARPVPSDDELKAYYDRRDWFEGGEKGGYQSYDAQTEWSLDWVNKILDQFPKDKELSILDVGCGYGTHLKLAAERGWKCFGVEPSAHARGIADERLGGAAYLVESVDELIPHEFDLILMLDTIEHLPTPYPTLYKLFSIGAILPKTKLVVSTPNAGAAEAEKDPAAWVYRHPPSHLVYYRAETLRYLFSRLHFTTIDVAGLAFATPETTDLRQAGGLLVTASGSDFAAFMQERYVPGTWSKIAEYEHVPRYALAKPLVPGKTVLDFGCGTGYGAAMLAETAASVTGLDIDAAAIAWAKSTHRNPKLTYIQAADLGASLPAKSFDVVTCFEMIEHVDHATQKAVIASFARLVKDDGVMLISTPNPETTKLYGANPYHIREMNEAELRELLAPHFAHVQVLEQHVRAGVAFEQGGTTLQAMTDAKATHSVPLAFIGVCAKARDITVPAQIFFDQSSDYIADFMNSAAVLNKARLAAYQQSEIAQSAKQQVVKVADERSEALKAREQARHEKNLADRERDAALQERNVAAHERNVTARERDAALHEKNIATGERDAALHAKNIATGERDAALHEKNLAAQEREAALHEKNLALRDREAALHERNLEKMARDKALEEGAHIAAARDRALDERDQARAERDRMTTLRDQAVAERDNVAMAYHYLHERRVAELQSPRFLAGRLGAALKLKLARKFGRASSTVTQAEQTRAELSALMAHPPQLAATRPPLLCSLVIPTKNGGALFKEVVAGLQRQSIWPRVEFIIVDSGSTDDTIATAQAAGAKCVSIPPAEFNHGATRDHAIALTTCDRVILSVQDAIPASTETLAYLVAALDDPKVAGAYARQIPQPDADLITRRNLNGWLTGRNEREVRELSDPARHAAMSPMEKYLFANFDNVCSIIRKSVWQEQKFGRINFGEDIDWSERVLKAGHRIVYEPAAAVVHSHDRPIAYEYKRTYVCHRKLYSQFGLQVMPSLRRGFGGWLRLTLADMAYVLRQPERLGAKLKLLFKLPVLNAYNVFGQYYGAKDEKAGRQKTVKGV